MADIGRPPRTRTAPALKRPCLPAPGLAHVEASAALPFLFYPPCPRRLHGALATCRHHDESGTRQLYPDPDRFRLRIDRDGSAGDPRCAAHRKRRIAVHSAGPVQQRDGHAWALARDQSAPGTPPASHQPANVAGGLFPGSLAGQRKSPSAGHVAGHRHPDRLSRPAGSTGPACHDIATQALSYRRCAVRPDGGGYSRPMARLWWSCSIVSR